MGLKERSRVWRTNPSAAIAIVAMALTGCSGADPAFEYVRLPGTEIGSGANMPFTSAIKVNSGSLVFLSGTTGAPEPQSHPHIPAKFDHLDFGAEAQTERVMESLKRAIEAAGGQLTDIVHVTRFVKDVDVNQDAINEVMNRYWGPNHRPTSTTIQIVRLATDPRFILEVEAVAVIPN